MWKSDASALSASTWLLKQPKLLSMPLFSPSWTIIILFYLAAHFTHYNSAMKLVFKAPKFDHMQSLLQAFHCLSVQAKIDYDLSTICHNFFSDSSLACFLDHLTVYTSSRQLCSSAETWILCIPHVTTKTFGKRCFSYYAPKQCCPFLSDIHRIMPSKLH